METKSDHWYYRAYLLQLSQSSPKLADGMDRVWNRNDTPLEERNKHLIQLLNIVQNPTRSK